MKRYGEDNFAHENVSRLILTSATSLEVYPDFIKPKNLRVFNYLADSKDLRRRLRIHRIDSDARDKLDTLRRLLIDIMPTGSEKTIIFVNYRQSTERVAESLRKLGADPGLYTGALDQHDREKRSLSSTTARGRCSLPPTLPHEGSTSRR